MKFNPTGTLNVAVDSSDIQDGDFTRCKNLRLDQRGQAKTRDGSAKLNSSAINTAIWWLEEMAGSRFAFAGDSIYDDETSIASGLTEAQWAAIQYNAYNDTTDNIFALNGTDRKRIEGGVVYEWGLAAPGTAPTLTDGGGSGLTGQFNVKYTYVRKVGGSIVAESNPSDAADTAAALDNQSLAVSFTQPSDSQVTHVRLYRTLANGVIYYLDSEVAANVTLTNGYVFAWEDADTDPDYIAGTGYKFTITDATNGSENTHSWEELFADREDTDEGTTSGPSGSPFTPGGLDPLEVYP